MRKLIIWLLCIGYFAAVASAQEKHDEHKDHDHGEHEEDAHEADAHEGHTDEVHLTPEAIKRNDIRVETASKRHLHPTIVVPARIAFDMESMAHVGTAVSGRVAEIRVKTGDKVSQGAELIVIQSPELGEMQSAYLQALTAAKVAESAVAPAQNAYERGKILYDEHQGISLADVQQREAELHAAQGALQNAQADVSAAGNSMSLAGMTSDAIKTLGETGAIDPRCVVTAPIAGEVIEREITLGELVSPDDEALLILANTQSLWVLAEVAEMQLALVSVGAEATIEIASRAAEPVAGKVSHIAAAMDARTRTAHVRIDLANPDGRLKPGMFAKASIQAGAADDAEVLAVPDEAIQTVEGGPAVFVPVEGEENTFAKRAVTIGPSVGGFIPILSGLADGEKFVVSGTFILKAELGKSAAGHDHAH